VVRLFLAEGGSAALREVLATTKCLVSVEIVRVEVLRAILRGDPAPDAADEAELWLDGVQMLRLDRELLARAERLVPPELRTLDALHLAAALSVLPSGGDFLCYDLRLARAARQHGFRVLAPGAEQVHEP
jgi:predicted nucleic acid-binding protein